MPRRQSPYVKILALVLVIVVAFLGITPQMVSMIVDTLARV
jgi:hypothetical protein